MKKKLLLVSLFLMSILVSFVYSSSPSTTFYNNINPMIEIEFNTDVNITFAEINNSPIIFNPFNEFSNIFTNHTNYTESGNYKLKLNATSRQGIPLNKIFEHLFYLNHHPPKLLEINPISGSTIRDVNTIIELTYNETIYHELCELDFLEGDGDYLFFENSETNKVNLNLTFFNYTQSYVLNISCPNIFSVYNHSIINYDASYFDIFLVEPVDGYSATSIFNITFNTTLSASNCMYYPNFDNQNITQLEDNFFYSFDNSTEKSFKKNNYQMYTSDIIEFFVRCYYNDSNNVKNKTFDIQVDTEPLVLNVISSDVVRSPLESNVEVNLNKIGQCRYSLENKSFLEMNILDDGDFKDRFNIVTDVTNNENYTFYISCKSKSGLITNTTTDFIVDTELDIGIDMNKPNKNYYPEKTQLIEIQTNPHSAICYYSINSTNVTLFDGNFGSVREVHSSTVDFTEGLNILRFKCIFNTPTGQKILFQSKEVRIDTFKPKINSINISQLNMPTGKTWKDDQLNVKLEVFQGNSGISKYLYLINSTNNSYSSGWIEKSSEDTTLYKNLENLTEYYVYAKIVSGSGLESDIIRSDSIFVNKSLKPHHCENNILDLHYESDTDCGIGCDECDDGKRCKRNSDCITDNCVLNDENERRCISPTCDDGIKNQDETGVDCGGDICESCKGDEDCLVDGDCKSNKCTDNICEAVDKCRNGEEDVNNGETDIDCGGENCNPCGINKKCNEDLDCDSRLECKHGICIAKTTEPRPVGCVPKCEEGFECKNNECVKIPTPTNECDPRCSIGYSCINGECIKDEDPNKDVDEDKFPIWLILLIIFLIIILTLVMLYFIFKGKTVTIFSKTIFIPDYFKSVNLDDLRKKITNKTTQNKPMNQSKYQVQFKPLQNKQNTPQYYNSTNTKEMISEIRKKREEQIKREQDLIKKKFQTNPKNTNKIKEF